MTTLVVGATGATGKLLVEQLLERGQHVKAVVRTAERLPPSVRNHENLTVIEAAVLDLTDEQLAEQVRGCAAVASCLGHNLTFKGMYGKPRLLVTDATKRLCEAVRANSPDEPCKFVLMNTTGNRNHDLNEQVSFAQRCVVGLIRICVPPHADNEQAADFLRTEIGGNDGAIEWSVVRPDSLIDEASVSDYEIHESPIRSAIFDAGKSSRINVANFMANLISDAEIWQEWKGRMPVIYNKEG